MNSEILLSVRRACNQDMTIDPQVVGKMLDYIERLEQADRMKTKEINLLVPEVKAAVAKLDRVTAAAKKAYSLRTAWLEDDDKGVSFYNSMLQLGHTLLINDGHVKAEEEIPNATTA